MWGPSPPPPPPPPLLLPSSAQGLFYRVNDTITKELLCVTVEIVNPLLRSWIGLRPGEECHYDLQVAE